MSGKESAVNFLGKKVGDTLYVHEIKEHGFVKARYVSIPISMQQVKEIDVFLSQIDENTLELSIIPEFHHLPR